MFGTQCVVLAIDAKARPATAVDGERGARARAASAPDGERGVAADAGVMASAPDGGREAAAEAVAPADAAAQWEAYLAGGRTPTGRDVVAWAREAVTRGAGEILLTSMDRDGTNDGYDLALTAAVGGAVGVPVIASGGAGELEHLAQALGAGADAALCASIFHYGRYTIGEAKEYLERAGIAVRR